MQIKLNPFLNVNQIKMKQINNSYDPGSLLSTLHEFINLIFTQAWEEVTVIVPYIFQIRE